MNWQTRLAGAGMVLITACSTTPTPTNEPIAVIDEDSGYRRLNTERIQTMGNTLVLLSLSGGGTRAAALSYGVMEELRDTLVPGEQGEIRLLDELDTISSVSGGSFTAAYYGLFRDRIFEDYEQVFLRQGVQRALVRQLFNPAHWWRSSFSGFDRTEMAVDYYDRKIFNGATFDDMKVQGPPFIEINATDLTTGLRFSFTQERFDALCTDLGSFSVARAVTASSAVPVAFPTVVLKNYADQCEIEHTGEWQLLQEAKKQADTESQHHLLDGLMSYRDVDSRKYIHLVDGGISDNLGLRSLIERLESLGDLGWKIMSENPPDNILIILVNAEVKPESFIEQSADKPSVSTTMGAFTSVQMQRYNQETLDRLQDNIDDFRARAVGSGVQTRVYFSEVSFDLVKTAEVNKFLNSMPTSLELEDIQVDRLIGAGRLLLRYEPQFKQYKKDNGARLAEGAISREEICREFDLENCVTNFTGE